MGRVGVLLGEEVVVEEGGIVFFLSDEVDLAVNGWRCGHDEGGVVFVAFRIV